MHDLIAFSVNSSPYRINQSLKKKYLIQINIYGRMKVFRTYLSESHKLFYRNKLSVNAWSVVNWDFRKRFTYSSSARRLAFSEVLFHANRRRQLHPLHKRVACSSSGSIDSFVIAALPLAVLILDQLAGISELWFCDSSNIWHSDNAICLVRALCFFCKRNNNNDISFLGNSAKKE